MSNKIDQRIVEMSFENAKFEKGILQSEKSLKSFTNSLSGLATSANTASLKGIEQSLQSLSQSFTAVGQIGVGALRRIGEAAINAGSNLFKGLAIDPITQGFGEMELKMNSTQTIMASTGESLAVVNQRLGELNEYSDKTIYSFSDMTANIGKFTNAGVKLDVAVASIKGISNAAALSGANADEASRAMYNFAQALSSGSVKLMDWKSIELANMATVEFKQQLIDSAVAAGTLEKQADGMYKVLSVDGSGKKMDGVISTTKNFNDSLSYQWMTTKALTSTLGRYADTTTDVGKRATIAATQVTTFSKLIDTLKESVGSGWAQTFEILLGDFNEARELWTGINAALGTAIGQMSDDRNNLLSGGLGSGWKQFMQEGISDTVAFGDTLSIVAKESGIDLKSMATKAGSMEKALKGNWLTGDMLTKTITKMSSSINKMSDEQLKAAGYTENTKAELLNLKDALNKGTISADDFAKKMSHMSGRDNIIEGLKNSVAALLTVLRPISKAFDQIFPPMTIKTLYEMTDNFKLLTKSLIISDETANKIQRTFAGLFAVVDIGWEVVKLLGSAFMEIVGAITPLNGGLLGTTATMGDFLVFLNKLIKGSGVFEYALLGIKIAAFVVGQIISTITTTFSDFVLVLLSAEHPLQFLGKTITSIFTTMFKTLESGTKWMTTKFFNALNSLQSFFTTKMNFGGDGTILTGILTAIKDFLSYLTNGGSDGIVVLGDALANLDFNKIATFVVGGTLLVLVNQLTRLTKVSGDLIETTNGFASKLTKKLFGPITKFKDLAMAIGILTASLFVLSTIPFDKLKNGLLGLGGAMVIFAASYAAMQAITVVASKSLNGVEAMQSALSLTTMAGALAVMAIAISKISKIDRGDVWNSVAVVGSMMGVIVAYQALTVAISKIPGTRAANVGMGLMASGLLGLIAIIAIMDRIEPEVIMQSLVKMSSAMLMLAGMQAMFAVAARISGGSKVAVNVLGISLGLLAMIGVIKLSQLLNPNEIASGAKNIFLLGGVLAAVQIMFSIASCINGGVKFKTNILAIQLGIASMLILTSIAGGMNQQELQNGIKNIVKMGALIGALELVTALAARLGGGQKLDKILGSITITMLGFTGLIAILGNMKPETIDQGFAKLTKLTGLIMAIELMSALIGSIRGSTNGTAALLGISLTILTLTSSLALLAMIDQESLAQAATSLSKAVIAIGLLGIGIAIMVKSLSGMTSSFSVLKNIVGMLIPGFVVLTAIFAASLVFLGVVNACSPMLQQLDWDSLLKFTAGMGILTVFIGAFTVLSKLPGASSGWKDLLGLVPGFIAVGGVVLAMAGMFAILAPLIPMINIINDSAFEKIIISLGFIGLMVVAMSMLSVPFAALGAVSQMALTGVGVAILGVGAIVISFVALAALMGALFNGNSDIILNGIDTLVLIANGMGRFIGAIAGGFASEAMVSYGKGLADFSVAISTIKPASFAGVESLSKAMLMLTGAALLDGLSRFVGLGANPGEVFGKQIAGMLKAFSTIETSSVDKFTMVIQKLKPALSGFSDLIVVAGKIPNSGGTLGILMGNNNMDKFGLQLAGLINSFVPIPLANVQSTTTKLNQMTPMLGSLKSFIEVAGTIPNSGGSLGMFVGNNNIDKFGYKLTGLISSFVCIPLENVKSTTIKLSQMVPMAGYLKDLIEVAGTIPNSGGLLAGLVGGNSIDKFAERLRGMVESLYAIDSLKLNSAMTNIRLITESLKLVGMESITTAVKALDSRKMDLSNSFTKVFDLTLTNSKKYVNEFRGLGENIVKGLQNGITSNQKLAITATDNMSKAVVISAKKQLDVHSPSKVFSDIGGWLGIGLGNGIEKNSKVAILASANMGGEVEGAIRNSLGVHSESKVFKGIGSWVPTSLGNGMEEAKKALLQKAKEMGLDTSSFTLKGVVTGMADKNGTVTTSLNTLLDMLSGKTSITTAATSAGAKTGGAVTDGMAGAISGDGKGNKKVNDAAEKVAKDAFEIFKAAIDKKKEYNQISVDQEIAAWKAFTAQQKAGSELRMKGDKELGRVGLENTKKLIEEDKYYKKISLEQELKRWEDAQATYKLMGSQGTQYRMEAEREVFRLKQEIWQEEYQHELDVIDDAKYYGKMTLSQELSAQNQIRKMTTENTDERKKNDREIFRLEKEIKDANMSFEKQLINVEKERTDARKKAADDYLQQEKDINAKLKQDIDSVRKSYEDAVDSRAKTLYSAYGLFDKVEVQEPLNGLDLVKNLEDQTKAFDDWQANIGALTAKGVDDGLIEELKEMGPKAKDQIVALNSLSSVELTRYVSLWRNKSADARYQAISELQKLKVSTELEIVQLTAATSVKLTEYMKIWADTYTSIDDNTKLQLADIQKSWTDSVGIMSSTGLTTMAKFKFDWFNEVETVVQSTKTQLLELQKFMNNIALSVPSISYGGKGGASLNDRSNFNNVGNNLMAGLSTGITKNSGMVSSSVDTLNKGLENKMNSFWVIASPAKKTIEIGKYIVMGLAGGLSKFSNVATIAAGGLGEQAMTAISSSMNTLSDVFDTGINPITITPVIDLSNVKMGVRNVNDMLSSMPNLDVSTSMGLLPTSNPSNGTNSASNATTKTDSQGSKPVSFIQNNYSPVALSRIDIYRQTKNQLDAVNLMKG